MPQTFKIELELISDDAPNPNKRTHIGKVIGTVQSISSPNKLCKKTWLNYVYGKTPKNLSTILS